MSLQLVEAIRLKNNAEVKRLVADDKVDVNVRVPTLKVGPDGLVTPLHIAAAMGNVDAIEALLTRRDIIIDPLTDTLCTPLHLAAIYRQPQSVKALFQVANTNAKDTLQRTPYRVAKNHLKTEAYKKAGQECIDILKIPTFVQACANGDLPLVKKMVEEEQVDINGVYKNNTGLMIACRYCQVDVVKYLISMRDRHKLNINMFVNNGTALHKACLPINLTRLENSESITTRAFKQKSENSQPLCSNVLDLPLLPEDEQSMRVEIVNLLISAGANINAADRDGDPAIMVAITFNQLDLVRLLAYRGADLKFPIKFNDETIASLDLPPHATTSPLSMAKTLAKEKRIDSKIYEFMSAYLEGKCLTRPMEIIAGQMIFKENIGGPGKFFTSNPNRLMQEVELMPDSQPRSAMYS